MYVTCGSLRDAIHILVLLEILRHAQISSLAISKTNLVLTQGILITVFFYCTPAYISSLSPSTNLDFHVPQKLPTEGSRDEETDSVDAEEDGREYDLRRAVARVTRLVTSVHLMGETNT